MLTLRSSLSDLPAYSEGIVTESKWGWAMKVEIHGARSLKSSV